MALDQREPSDKILEQFGRQILVPGVDEDGQLQLTQRKICIIGIGALGTIASQYLVRSGIGDIHLIDPDVIEESNLHRQINYTLDDIGKYKSEVSKKILTNINDNDICELYYKKNGWKHNPIDRANVMSYDSKGKKI